MTWSKADAHYACHPCNHNFSIPMELVCWCGWGSIKDGKIPHGRDEWPKP